MRQLFILDWSQIHVIYCYTFDDDALLVVVDSDDLERVASEE